MLKTAMQYRLALVVSSLALAVAGGASFVGRAADAPAAGTEAPKYRGISKPCEGNDVVLSFVHPGRMAKLNVKLGDSVKAGQVIAEQDMQVELASLEADQADADNDTEEQAELANQKKDEVDYEKIKDNEGSSAFEKRDAELKVVIDKARVKLTHAKQEKAIIKLKGTKKEIERLTLSSPIDGVIAQSYLQVGESADGGNMKVVRVVQLDPLWIEAPIPIAVARKLNKGDPAQVEFTDKVRDGKVALVSPLGDSASGTILVRIEVKNPEKISAGENVKVTFGPGTPVARP